MRSRLHGSRHLMHPPHEVAVGKILDTVQSSVRLKSKRNIVLRASLGKLHRDKVISIMVQHLKGIKGILKCT